MAIVAMYKFMIVWLLAAQVISPMLTTTPGTTIEEQNAAEIK
jgi:hypothetical protein